MLLWASPSAGVRHRVGSRPWWTPGPHSHCCALERLKPASWQWWLISPCTVQSKDPSARKWILEQPYLRVPRAMPVSILRKYLNARLGVPAAAVELLHSGASLPHARTVSPTLISPSLSRPVSCIDCTLRRQAHHQGASASKAGIYSPTFSRWQGHDALLCAQVEEVVTAFAPACNDGKGIFEITFTVATPAQEW